jgi:hypothetical protein
MEEPGVSGFTLERTMSRNISCHHRGFRLDDCRSSSAGVGLSLLIYLILLLTSNLT